MLQNLRENLSKKQKTTLLVVTQFLLVIVALVVVKNVNPTRVSKIELSNFQSAQNDFKIPKENIEDLKHSLIYELSKKYSRITDEELRFSVRDTTLEFKKIDGDVSKIKFLLDNDNLKESFNIELLWSKSGKSYYDVDSEATRVKVSCPKKIDMKYPETFCRTTYNSTDSIELYVPYESSDFSISENDEEKNALNLNIKVCSEKSKEEIRKEGWDYIKSTAIDLEKYTIVEKEYCPHS